MSVPVPIATHLRAHPGLNHGLYAAFEAGWQEGLHEAGGAYHHRYDTPDPIPFALAFAEETDDPDRYNPLLVTRQERVIAFDYIDVMSNVTADQLSIDDEIARRLLGVDEIPPAVALNFSRPQVFAAAKLFLLASRRWSYTSFNWQGATQRPGQFGFAGAVRNMDLYHTDQTMASISGAWHIEDNAVAVLALGAARTARNYGIEGMDGADIKHLSDQVRVLLRDHISLSRSILARNGTSPDELDQAHKSHTAKLISLTTRPLLEKRLNIRRPN